MWGYGMTALKTYQKRWMIGRSGERGSGIPILAARWWWYIYIYIWIKSPVGTIQQQFHQKRLLRVPNTLRWVFVLLTNWLYISWFFSTGVTELAFSSFFLPIIFFFFPQAVIRDIVISEFWRVFFLCHRECWLDNKLVNMHIYIYIYIYILGVCRYHYF